jgi:hypothetical protein
MSTGDADDVPNPNIPFERKPGGVFLTKGMGVRIPTGGLTFSLNPDVESRIELHVFFDVCPTWLDIALRRAIEAEEGRAELLAAWATPDNERVRLALEREFEVSMQAMAAAAIAVDAFYASVKGRIEIPQDAKDAWRKNRTARHAQVSEVLRLAFKIDPKSFDTLRTVVKEIMRFRDLAVHPKGQHDAPVLHPVLKQDVEWRFVVFASEKAKNAASLAISIVAQMIDSPKEAFPDLTRYCTGLKDRVQPIVERWEERYGPLWRKAESDSKADAG